MAKIKLKPKARKGVITIKALIKHPMETGLRKKKGKLVPANIKTKSLNTHQKHLKIESLLSHHTSRYITLCYINLIQR
jgi:sulfur-oxidizing protein SoxZ